MTLKEHRFQKTINLAAVTLMTRLTAELDAISHRNPYGLPLHGSPGNIVQSELAINFYPHVAETALNPVQALAVKNPEIMPSTIIEVPNLILETFIALIEKRKTTWLDREDHTPFNQYAYSLDKMIGDIRRIGEQIKTATADLPFDYGR